MASSPPWLASFSDAVGSPDQLRSLGGRAWQVTIGGRSLLVKSGPGVTDEAEGLRQLSNAAGPGVPGIVLAAGDLLVTEWVDGGTDVAPDHERLGRALGHLHAAPFPVWGGGSSWIGECRVDPAPASNLAGFYGRRLGDLASRCGLSRQVAPVVARLDDLVAPTEPSLLHGDLWWGNVVFERGGRPFVIDPSVHGGHPEEDLAMLALFGPVPDSLYRAYEEVAPLSPGWRDRIGLWQLYPLLVHSVLFGGGYLQRTADVARRYD